MYRKSRTVNCCKMRGETVVTKVMIPRSPKAFAPRYKTRRAEQRPRYSVRIGWTGMSVLPSDTDVTCALKASGIKTFGRKGGDPRLLVVVSILVLVVLRLGVSLSLVLSLLFVVFLIRCNRIPPKDSVVIIPVVGSKSHIFFQYNGLVSSYCCCCCCCC